MQKRRINRILMPFTRDVDPGKYIPEVDGIRFAAILFVFIQHLSERLQLHGAGQYAALAPANDISWLASRGTIGVFIFFCLSGFILALPLMKRMNRGGGIGSYKQYIARRITRIEPPYFIWMALFFGILALQNPIEFNSLSAHWAASVFYVHNIVFNTYSTINPVAWSLEVEWQFYLIAPFLVFLYFRSKNKSVRRFFGVLIIVIVSLLQSSLGWDSMPYKASILGNFVFFGLGIMLADFYVDGKFQSSQKRKMIWDFICTAGLVILPFTWSSEPLLLMAFLIGIAMFFVGVFKGSFWNTIFTNPWVTAIGGMCYTIYLIHLPLLEGLTRLTGNLWLPLGYAGNLLFQFLVTGAAVLVFSAVAYLLLEKPFMSRTKGQKMSDALIEASKLILVRISFNKMFRAILLVLFFSVGTISSAQTNGTSQINDDPILEIDLSKPDIIDLKPLDELIELALEHSAELEIQDLKAGQYDEQMKLMKREWSDYVTVGGSYQYGSGAYLDAISSLSQAETRYNDRQTSLYQVGVFVRVPVSEVLNRSTRANIIRSNQQIEQLESIDIQNRIRENVVRYYNTIESRVKILRIKADELQSLTLAVSLAEKYLEQGVLDIDEYTTAISRQAKTAREFEELQADALYACYMLKQLVGSPIINYDDLEMYDQ